MNTNSNLMGNVGNQMFPNLKWSWKVGEKTDPSQVYYASKRLSRHMMVAEELIVSLFPGLHIDLEQTLGKFTR